YKFMCAGLFLGIAFGVSMKSILFVAALSVAFIATVVLARLHPELRASHLAIGSAAVLLVPAIIAGAFTLSGAWKPFLYGVVEHNTLPFEHVWRVFWVVPLYPLIRFIA